MLCYGIYQCILIDAHDERLLAFPKDNKMEPMRMEKST